MVDFRNERFNRRLFPIPEKSGWSDFYCNGTRFGETYRRPFRNVIDILAIIATVMGIATSIGLGILQIAGGLNHVFKVPNTSLTLILITLLMTLIFLGSALTGINRGVKWLSNINIMIGALLLLFILFSGFTIYRRNIHRFNWGLFDTFHTV